GVESAKEDSFLNQNGINARQGFLFPYLRPAVAFERWYIHFLKRD
ncbi:cyclic di-GMP phosphodiesterase, partial [Escherichia coli]